MASNRHPSDSTSGCKPAGKWPKSDSLPYSASQASHSALSSGLQRDAACGRPLNQGRPISSMDGHLTHEAQQALA
eukprot:579169-Amphidinium_carterae.2